MAKPRRIREIFNIGFPVEDSEGLKLAVSDGLFTVSDMIRIYVRRGLIQDGYLPPPHTRAAQQPQANGGAAHANPR